MAKTLESIVYQQISTKISTIQKPPFPKQQCRLWVSHPSGIMNLVALPKRVVQQALLEMENMGSCV